MGGVFANGLEISGKSVQAQTIAAFPDVCMTPPENPATPPGVPVPYPNFAMASDTEKGTGKVKIKNKEVNLKNKSDMKRTSGDEAGCAAKKGVITSKNMGKSYFNAWSPDVKFEGKPVVRMSDITTNNHASPVGNTPPWPHIASMNVAGGDCEAIYAELGGHAHKDNPCNASETGRWSEHTIRAATLQRKRSTTTCSSWPKYDDQQAPCICMNSRRINKRSDEPSLKGMPHDKKTKSVKSFLNKCRVGCMSPSGSISSCKKKCVVPTAGEMLKVSVDATSENHSRIKKKSEKEQEQMGECLTLINMAYMAGVDEKDTEAEAKKKMDDAKKKPVCTKGVCKATKAATCHGCGT